MSRSMSYALTAAMLSTVAIGAFAFRGAWADIQASNDLKTTVGALSNEGSSQALLSNISILQSKIDSLDAQISAYHAQLSSTTSSSAYATLQSKITQLEATVSALQSITSRLLAGYTITNYTVSTDSSTLVNSITITFSKGNATTTLTASIPPVVTSDSEDSENEDSSADGSDAIDMLTQALQQAGAQMLLNMAGAANPLSSVQNTLNGLVSAANNPQPLAIPQGADIGGDPSTKMACKADGSSGAASGTPGTAVYDISAGTVTMPDGTVLEAHSGMGIMTDNPAYVNQRMNGPTPPNTYTLSLREGLYHNVEAIRMTPSDPGSMYGRDGILAHSKLVGGNNGSHGCVAFADYAKFLAAFKSGQVTKMVVVGKGSGSAPKCESIRYEVKNPYGAQ